MKQSIAYNNIHDEGISMLTNALQDNKALSTLNIGITLYLV